jgi:hypothetical protein
MESHDTELERELRQTLLTAAEPIQGDGVRQDAIRRTVARRRRTRRTVRFSLVGVAAAATVAVAFLVSSGGEDTLRMVDRRPSSTSTTTTTAPDREPTPDRSTTSSSTTVPESSTTSTPTTSTTPSTTATSSTTTQPPLPGFPPQFTGVTQGGQTWALYLAVVPQDQYGGPEYQAAEAALAEAGYRNSGGSLACDHPAPEALGRDSSSVTVGVYFESQAQAEQARTAFQARNHSVVGVVHVKTYCLD